MNDDARMQQQARSPAAEKQARHRAGLATQLREIKDSIEELAALMRAAVPDTPKKDNKPCR
jgi:chaperonin cofactor prefoldin